MIITWKNVQGPNLSRGASILDSAGRQLQQGIAGIGQIAREGEDRRLQGIQDNSDAFLEAARQQFRDPNKLREAQESGALDTLRNSFGDIDAGRTGASAIDSLVQSGQQRVTSDNAFSESEARRASKPLEDEVARLRASGDFDGADRVLADNDLFNEGAIAELNAASRQGALRETERVADREFSLGQRDVQAADRQRQIARQNRQDQIQETNQARQLEEFARQDADRAEADAAENVLNDTFSKIREGHTSSDIRGQAFIDLRAKGIPVAKATTLASAFAENLSANTGLTAGESQERDSRINSLSSKYKNNSIIRDQAQGKTPADIASNALDSFDPNSRKISGAERDNVIQTLSNIASDGGIKVDGKTIPVSETMLKLALSEIDDDNFFTETFFSQGEKLSTILKEKAEKGAFSKELKEYEQYEQEKSVINDFYQQSSDINNAASLANVLRSRIN